MLESQNAARRDQICAESSLSSLDGQFRRHEKQLVIRQKRHCATQVHLWQRRGCRLIAHGEKRSVHSWREELEQTRSGMRFVKETPGSTQPP